MDDLTRARTKVPRAGYKGSHFYSMGKVLNSHMSRNHPRTKPCHQWTAAELQGFQEQVWQRREAAHDAIYHASGDNRRLRFQTLGEHKQLWAEVRQAAAGHTLVEEMRRDGHCHEAVMWWVHHLSHATKQQLAANVTVPLLPLVQWREPIAEEGAGAQKVYAHHYNPSSTCQACHGGGVPWQDPNVEPPPFPRQVNGKDRQRRCEEWYGPEEGGVCGPCDGIAGWYWGDMPDNGTYTDCKVVKKAEEVPEADRMPTAFPKAFAVEMRGADRWPRASAGPNASCGYTTDCSPIATGDQIGDPQAGTNGHNYHWYAPIHGVLYVDRVVPPGVPTDGSGHTQFLGGRLRHETVYQFPNGQAGVERALKGMFGETNKHLTEIHMQTADQATANNPGVMLNLDHKKMTKANASGTDDSTLDWRRIPSTDGFCTCIPDPAGLPDFMGAYSNATYKGRVTFVPQGQTTGTGGPPDGKPIVCDHWVKWVFHLFVDTTTRMPAMFSSPFGGVATYGNWSLSPDTMWPEWRVNPQKCLNPTKSADCPKGFNPFGPPSGLKTPSPPSP